MEDIKIIIGFETGTKEFARFPLSAPDLVKAMRLQRVLQTGLFRKTDVRMVFSKRGHLYRMTDDEASELLKMTSVDRWKSFSARYAECHPPE